MLLIVFGVNGKKIIPKVLISYISKRAIKFALSDPADSKETATRGGIYLSKGGFFRLLPEEK